MSKKVTFTELVNQIAKETGTSQKLIHDLLIETSAISTEMLAKHGKINLTGLGKFTLNWHEERSGKNPQTGGNRIIKAHYSVAYKPAKSLREFINKPYAHLLARSIEADEQPHVKTTITKSEDAEAIKSSAESKPKTKVDTQQNAREIDTQIKKLKSVVEFQTPPNEVIAKKKEKKRKRSFAWMILLIIVVAISAYLVHIYNDFHIEQDAHQQVSVVDESQTNQSAPVKAGLVSMDEKPQLKAEAAVKEASKEAPTETPIRYASPGGTHQTKSGEYLRSIAEKFYNHADVWPLIYKANLDKIANPDALESGLVLEIPPLQGAKNNYSDSDNNEIAEGFVLVYLAYKKQNKASAYGYLWTVNKWGNNHILNQYKNKIDPNDLQRVENIEGDTKF